MESYRLIGTGTTDASGVARCNTDYTGTGKGKVDMVASLDNPIVEGSLQSEPYELCDAQFYDSGTDSTVEKWAYRNATLSKTVDGTGSLVTNSNSGFGTIYANVGASTTWSDLYDFSAPIKVEFDIVSIAGGGSITLNDGVNPSQITFETYSFADNTHVSITIESNRYKVKVGETEYNWVSHSLVTNFGVAIRLNNASSSIKFKNFKIYPV